MFTLSVEVEGSGTPLVLVPGFACAPNVWYKVRPALLETFELHMVTVPGFGGISRIEPPVMPKVIDALGSYCGRLGGAVLIGHSVGGTLTFGVAARTPEAIAGAVVVDGLPYFPTVFAGDATPESMREFAEKARDALLNSPPPKPGGKTYFDEHIIDPQDAAYMNETTPPSDRLAMADVRFESLTTDLRPETTRIQAPVLVIGAGQPWIKKPEDVDETRQWYADRLGDISDLELVINERARHFVMIDYPDWFVDKVIQFAQRIS